MPLKDHAADLAAIFGYFAVLIRIGVRVRRAGKGEESESFLAAVRALFPERLEQWDRSPGNR